MTHPPGLPRVEVATSGTSAKVGYLSTSGGGNRQDFFGTFGVSAAQLGQDLAVTITCPSAMQIQHRTPWGTWDPFIPREKAAADLDTMCDTAQLKFVRKEGGEVNVNFPDSSVYANFARKQKPYTYRNGNDQVTNADIAKFKWFEVTDGKSTRILGITVFPYRSGSKVTYRWDNEVNCSPKSGCNYDASAAKRMHEAVVAIAND